MTVFKTCRLVGMAGLVSVLTLPSCGEGQAQAIEDETFLIFDTPIYSDSLLNQRPLGTEPSQFDLLPYRMLPLSIPDGPDWKSQEEHD